MPDPAYDPSKEVLALGRDNSLRVVPKGDAAQVAESGGRVLDTVEGMKYLHQVEETNRANSARGQAETLVGSAASGALAVPAALAGGTGEQAVAGLLGRTPEDVVATHERMRSNAEANPTLQAVGSTVGAALPAMLAGGGIGAAAGRLGTALGVDAAGTALAEGGGLVGRLAGKALQAAPGAAGTFAENAAFGVGAANEDAFLQNREMASDEVAGAGLVGGMLGLGIGAGFRGAEFVGSKVGQKVLDALPENFLRKTADSAAARDAARGAPKSLFNGMSQEETHAVGNRMLREGVTGKAPQEAVDMLESKIGQVGEKKAAIEALAAPHFDGDALVEKLRATVADLKADPTAASQSLAKKVANQANLLENHFAAAADGTLDRNALDGVMSVRNDIANQVKRTAADTPAGSVYRRMKADINNSLGDAIGKADAGLGGGGNLHSDWQALEKEHGQLSVGRDAYKAKIPGNETSGAFSEGEKNTATNSGMLFSLATGHLGAGALMGAMTGIGRKIVDEKGASWLAHAADWMASRGEAPSLTAMLAASSEARQQLGHYAVAQMVSSGTKAAMSQAIDHPAGFAYGALAHYQNPKSVADQYTAATNYLKQSDGDVQGMAERANQHLGGLADEQPELAQAAQMKAANAIAYLREMQPVVPQASILSQAFGTSSKQLPPNAAQVSFLRRFRASVDPSVIYGEIARGYVNPETVDTLATLYPSYLASVRMGTLQAINSQPGLVDKMSYSQRLALDNLMGGDGQVEPTRKFSVQDRLQQANQEMMQQSASPAPSPRKIPQIAQQSATTSSKLMTAST